MLDPRLSEHRVAVRIVPFVVQLAAKIALSEMVAHGALEEKVVELLVVDALVAIVVKHFEEDLKVLAAHLSLHLERLHALHKLYHRDLAVVVLIHLGEHLLRRVPLTRRDASGHGAELLPQVIQLLVELRDASDRMVLVGHHHPRAADLRNEVHVVDHAITFVTALDEVLSALLVLVHAEDHPRVPHGLAELLEADGTLGRVGINQRLAERMLQVGNRTLHLKGHVLGFELLGDLEHELLSLRVAWEKREFYLMLQRFADRRIHPRLRRAVDELLDLERADVLVFVRIPILAPVANLLRGKLPPEGVVERHHEPDEHLDGHAGGVDCIAPLGDFVGCGNLELVEHFLGPREVVGRGAQILRLGVDLVAHIGADGRHVALVAGWSLLLGALLLLWLDIAVDEPADTVNESADLDAVKFGVVVVRVEDIVGARVHGHQRQLCRVLEGRLL
mmetsp:Transcript_28658/g.66547  ORF Transcript_28658/g.66547 Transcript_28658/m.66547 type:complete len:448 (-) Transcript_28658:3071-4414(-)